MKQEKGTRKSRKWREVRRKILLEDNSTCGICGYHVDKNLPSHTPASPEVDHIVPLALGGAPFSRTNLQLSHKLCNQRKNKGEVITRLGTETNSKSVPNENNDLGWFE